MPITPAHSQNIRTQSNALNQHQHAWQPYYNHCAVMMQEPLSGLIAKRLNAIAAISILTWAAHAYSLPVLIPSAWDYICQINLNLFSPALNQYIA
jgi:hypothetical protein